MLNAIITLPLRSADKWGSGAFRAPRGDREHTGVDFAVEPGALLLSPLQGIVSKWGQVYKDTDEYQYVQITDEAGRQHRFYYTQPIPILGDSVEPGDVIGTVQDITARYDERMTNHVHYEIRLRKMSGYIYDNPLEE